MQTAIFRYAAVAHVFLLAAFLAWFLGGREPVWPAAAAWICFITLEMTLLLPPVRRNETLEAARRRTIRGLLRDPLLWLGGAALFYLLLQALNGGRALVFDALAETWTYAPPPLGGGPFSVVPAEARQVLLWMLAAFTAALAVRHGTSRRGKLYLLRLLVAHGAVLSLFGILRHIVCTAQAAGAGLRGDQPFATFGYANHAGAFFTLLFVLGGGLFLHAALDVAERIHTRWLPGAMALNFAGAMFSLGRAAILFSWTVALLGGLFCLIYAWPRLNLTERMRTVILGAGLLLLAPAFFFAYPHNPVRRELATIEWGGFFGRLFGDRWVQTATALRIWEDHPWFGVGGMGYRRFVGHYLEPDKWQLLHRGADNVLNDPVQFLCEHGAVGFSLLLAAVLVLLVPIAVRLHGAYHSGRERWDGHRWLLFRVSPVTLAALGATALVFGHSLIDMPFRSPAILVAWTVILASAPAFLPARPAARGPLETQGRATVGAEST